MVPGYGLMAYDVLPDRMLQYEKPTKAPFFNEWGRWASHEMPFASDK